MRGDCCFIRHLTELPLPFQFVLVVMSSEQGSHRELRELQLSVLLCHVSSSSALCIVLEYYSICILLCDTPVGVSFMFMVFFQATKTVIGKILTNEISKFKIRILSEN